MDDPQVGCVNFSCVAYMDSGPLSQSRYLEGPPAASNSAVVVPKAKMKTVLTQNGSLTLMSQTDRVCHRGKGA